MSVGSILALINTLEMSIAGVESGDKHPDACCTLVGPSMKDTGIRPEVVSMTPDGDKIYLLNVRQARKLRERCLEGLEVKAREDENESD